MKQEQTAIDSQYEKRRKQAEIAQKMWVVRWALQWLIADSTNHVDDWFISAQSTQTNKSRLKLLQRREEHIQDLFDTTREQISEIAKDEGRYSQLLEGFILQVRSYTAATAHATSDASCLFRAYCSSWRRMLLWSHAQRTQASYRKHPKVRRANIKRLADEMSISLFLGSCLTPCTSYLNDLC